MNAAAADPAVSGTKSPLARLATGQLDDDIVDLAVGAIRRSTRPVPLPGLMNVLWFERGGAGGYDGAAFGEYLQGLPYFSHEPPGRAGAGRVQDAVPVGALVKVVIGDSEAWGEVIWKEGAHPLVGPGWVPGWLAGAPAGIPDDGPPSPGFEPGEGPRSLWERLVVDFACLGEGFVPREEKLARERRLERRFDRYGHLISEVAYPPGLDQADEVTFWAAWTVRNHSQALAAAGVPPDASVLGEAASVLAAALDTRDDVLSFGPYYIASELYHQVVDADARDDGPLRRSVRGLAHVPHHEQVAWASMSARLTAAAGDELPVGDRWPLAAVCASLLGLDTLAAEAADGDWNGVHVRLDDPWQGGGLWRAELLGIVTPVAADPAVALGLGWVAHTGGVIDRMPAVEEDFDRGEDDLDWSLVDSEVTWVTHLSTADLDCDRLRIPKPISELIVATLHALGQDQILVALRHDGEPEAREFSPLDEDGHLGVVWPLGVWAGTTVRITWPLEQRIVTAQTRLLGEPELVGDVGYTHEFNLAVALAAAGLADRVSRTATISQLVRAVVRRHGALTEDGRVALSLDEVVTFCFGPAGETVGGYNRAVLARAVRSAVWAMSAAGVASLEGESVVVSERITGAGRRADSDLLARFVDVQSRRLRRAARKHFVPATVVNLPVGWSRSEDKDADWAEVAGTDYLPEGSLGPGQTWRRRHTRGQAADPHLVAELERTKEAIRRLGGDEEVTAILDNAVADPYASEPDSPPWEARNAPGAP